MAPFLPFGTDRFAKWTGRLTKRRIQPPELKQRTHVELHGCEKRFGSARKHNCKQKMRRVVMTSRNIGTVLAALLLAVGISSASLAAGGGGGAGGAAAGAGAGAGSTGTGTSPGAGISGIGRSNSGAAGANTNSANPTGATNPTPNADNTTRTRCGNPGSVRSLSATGNAYGPNAGLNSAAQNQKNQAGSGTSAGC